MTPEEKARRDEIIRETTNLDALSGGALSRSRPEGFDYSMGTANTDPETGIHFGVINMNELYEYAWEHVESVYGDPCCPKCSNVLHEYEGEFIDKLINDKVIESEDELANYTKHSCADYICESCGLIVGSDETVGDEEPCGHTLKQDGYEGTVDSYNDLMVLKSPYYTRAQFCSPCVPGAGNLSEPCESGPKTYCLGHEWHPGGKAPYPVYRVDNNELVPPTEKNDGTQ
jgi:hypothetical protein